MANAKKALKKSAAKNKVQAKVKTKLNASAPKKSQAKTGPKASVKSAPKSASKSAFKSKPKAASKSASKSMLKTSAKPAPKAAFKGLKKSAGAVQNKSSKKPSLATKVPAQVAASAGRKMAMETTSAKTANKMSAKSTGKKSANIGELFSPLDDRVLVERAGVAERTAGGLFIPEMVKERPNQGLVLAVGRGKHDKKGRLRPLDVKVGDTVMFMKWAGAECTITDKELVILREADIYGVVKA